MTLEFEVIQSGQVVDVDVTTPALTVDVIQAGAVVDVDVTTPALEVDILQSGAVEDVWVLAGPLGPEGPPGIPGPGGYYAEVNFASAATTWTITLPVSISSYATNVDTLTFGGDEIEGAVTRPDASTIQIDWYYPTAGTARVYR